MNIEKGSVNKQEVHQRTEPTLEQVEARELPSQPDTVSLVEGKFVGSVHYYVIEGDKLVLKMTPFSVDKEEPVADFFYAKPGDSIQEGVLITNPVETMEENLRSGYHKLISVQNALRLPNHMHKASDGSFYAIENNNGEWETRFFPEDNIS